MSPTGVDNSGPRAAARTMHACTALFQTLSRLTIWATIVGGPTFPERNSSVSRKKGRRRSRPTTAGRSGSTPGDESARPTIKRTRDRCELGERRRHRARRTDAWRERAGRRPATRKRGVARGGQAMPSARIRADLKRVNQRATEERANTDTRAEAAGRKEECLPSIPPPRASMFNIVKPAATVREGSTASESGFHKS